MFDLVTAAYAQCPVCVVTVGGGLFLAKALHIDDLLVSIWLAALNTAIAYWLAGAVKSKAKVLKNGFLWSVAFYLMTIGSLMATKQIGHRGNTFLHIDKIVFGMTYGYLVSLLAIGIDKLIRKNNNGKVLFFYQKVIIPLVILIVSTVAFALLIKIYRR